jgi:hypothetical protein
MHFVCVFGPPAVGKMTVGHEHGGVVRRHRRVRRWSGRLRGARGAARRTAGCNGSEFRLEQKRSKRDLAFSHQNVIDLDSTWVMNTGGEPTVAEAYLARHDYVRVDNTHLCAADVAQRVVDRFALPGC